MKRLLSITSLLCVLALATYSQAQTTDPYFSPTDRDQYASPMPVDPSQGGFNAFGANDARSQYESIYRSIWAMIGNMYYQPEKLANWAEWEHKFDGKIKSDDELDLAIQQMVESLGDQWTRYVTRLERIRVTQEQRAGLLGLGVQVKKDENGAFYIDYIEWGSAAHNSELRRGDNIIAVGATALAGKSVKEANELLKGEVDTTVDITYAMNNGQKRTAKLAVAFTADQEVIAQVADNNLLYLRLPDFENRRRTAEFLNAIKGVGEKMQGAPVKGVILDLRGNPGGEITESLVVASIFLKDGVIVTSKTRSGRVYSKQTYEVVPPLAFSMNDAVDGSKDFIDSLLEAPMVVLTDENTASAAEIVTGALKDNKRATIIGKTTYGKGVGYATSTGPTGGVVTITGLEYLTPSGYNLARKGINPDIESDHPRGEVKDVQLLKAIEFLSNKDNNK